MNKRKIINDPIYGFININSDLLFDLLEHPYFQRLRRIKQLGLTNYVYPGANHTRFQHALGTIYLINSAINVIRLKGHEITPEEEEAVSIAILLHDVGHGPFSHALEHVILNVSHEAMSELFMQELNLIFNQKLNLAIKIFNNQYEKQFLHELVSSQLDMDRLDYLKRDSFFTGVTEGVIGSDRIIKMLDVVDDKLVVESKGIYSIEKFLIARRLMYWQVYLHKTVLSAEYLMLKILQRVKQLSERGYDLFATPSFRFFLNKDPYKNYLNINSIAHRQDILRHFSQLDDNDIVCSLKIWANSSDFVLSKLSANLLNRNLYKIKISDKPFDNDYIDHIKEKFAELYKKDNEVMDYFVFYDEISNNAYNHEDEKIQILYNDGSLYDIADASDILNMSDLSKTIKKYFLCYPKDLLINNNN
jgi:hypothetical protein